MRFGSVGIKIQKEGKSMKKMRKVFSLFLVFAVTLGLVQTPFAGSVTAFGGEVTERLNGQSSGTLGDIAWKLEEDTGVEWDLAQGTPLKLTLSGSGALSMESPYYAPWFLDRETITSITMEEGITEIGNGVFKSIYPSLQTVTFADSVTVIGESAFESCPLLTNLNFGNGLKEIRAGAFQKCNELKSVTLPDSVETVGNSAFNKCQDLAELVCGTGLRTIGESAFYQNALSKIEFNEGLQTIGKNAFGFNMQLTEVDLKEGLEIIDEQAFSCCSVLETVSLPNSLTTLKKYCFEGTAISSFAIPQNVTSIEYAILGASSCQDIQVAEGNENFCVKNNTLYELKEGIPYRAIAFASKQRPSSFAVEEGTQIIDVYALSGVGASTITLPDTLKEIRTQAFMGCSSVKEIRIPDGVEVIGDHAFDQCREMTQVTIGKNVREVGKDIFSNCLVLETIAVSGESPYLDVVENVLYNKEHTCLYAYARGKQDTEYHVLDGVQSLKCLIISASLKKLYMPASLLSLPQSSIYASNLDSIYFSGNAPSLEVHGIYLPSKDLVIYRIPGTSGWEDEQWSSFTFADWTPEDATVEEGTFDGVSWVYEGESGSISFTGSGAVPDFTLGEAAPWNAYMSSIQTIQTEGVSGIGDYAFCNAGSLVRIKADDALKEIGDYAFAGCGKLSLPGIDAVDKIGAFAFQNNSSIAGYFVLDHVTDIGAGAFLGCTGITDAAFGTSLVSLEERVLEGCSALETLLLPETVTAIKANALKGCSKLSDIQIPVGVNLIGSRAFDGDTSLKRVYFSGGVPSEWAADSFENCGSDLTLYYRTSQEGWGGQGDTWNGLTLTGLDRFYTERQDHYSFANTASSFGYERGYRVPRQRYVDVLTSITTGTYYYAVNNAWGGSCYGMLGSSLEFYKNPEKLADYSPSAKMTYEIAAPMDKTAALTKWIEGYNISQYRPYISGTDGEIMNHMRDYKGLIKRVEEFERSGGFLDQETEPLIMTIYDYFKGAHAVVPVSVDQAENGDFLLKIYDPNDPSKLQTLTIYKELNGIAYDGYTWASYVDYSTASQAMSGITLHDAEKDASVYLSVDKENGTVTDAEGRGIDEIEGAYEQMPLSGEEGFSGVRSFVLPKGSYRLFTDADAGNGEEGQAAGETDTSEDVTFYMASEDMFAKVVSSDGDAALSVNDPGTENSGAEIEIQSKEGETTDFTLVNREGMERTVEVKGSNAAITVTENSTITVRVPEDEASTVSIDGKTVQTDNGKAECSFVVSADENPLKAGDLVTDISFDETGKLIGTADASVVLNAGTGQNADVKVEYMDESGKGIASYSVKKDLKAGLNLIGLSFTGVEPSFLPEGEEAVLSCRLTVTDETGSTAFCVSEGISVKLPEHETQPGEPDPPVEEPDPPIKDSETPSEKPGTLPGDSETPVVTPPGTQEPSTETPPATQPAAEVTKVKVKPTKLTLGVGESFRLQASVLPENAENQELSYQSSNKKVTVSSKGKIVAKKVGTCKVTIRSVNGKTAVVKVTVKKAPKKITLNAGNKVLRPKGKFQIKVKLPKGTASNTITYTSNKKSVAVVSSSGKITAGKKGRAVITVKTYNGKKAKIKITVR